MVEFTPVQRTETLTRDEFLEKYKKPERPVIIERLTEGWPARRKWNLDFLKETAGDVVVPVYESTPSRDRKHQHAAAGHIPLAEYIERVENGEKNLRLFFFNFFNAIPDLTKDFEYPDIGLKFFRKLPVLFMGGKGARVQLHFDIDRADIVLCHFGGHKRVKLFPPGQTQYLYRVPFSFSGLYDANIEHPDYDKYPALKYARGQVAELDHGDALYIPPGWWHYVEYDEASFSMSLRAFPRTARNAGWMAWNILALRTVDGLMRKSLGQAWNDRNERMAVRKTHSSLKILR